jgi:N-acetyl-anhydromuramoyl-L-alanine amidase
MRAVLVAQEFDMPRVLWKSSPFYKSRGNSPLDMIVIHHIGSKDKKFYSIEGTITWFTDVSVHKNPKTGAIENQVSAHYAIPREPHSDYDVVQFVKEADIAYHAGDSQWVVGGKTRKFINSYSVGIELEGDGNLAEYTDFQYDTLIELVSTIKAKYKITDNNIVGHEDIAPTRKVDPGKLFDWMRLRKGINPVIVAAPSVAPIPDSATPKPAIPQTPPSTPIGKMPESQFHMSGGTNKDGKSPGWLSSLLKVILGLLTKS